MTAITHDHSVEEPANSYERQRQAAQVLMMLLDVARREDLPLPSWFFTPPEDDFAMRYGNNLSGAFDTGRGDAVEAWGAVLGVPTESVPRFCGDGFIRLITVTMLGQRVEIRAYTD